MLRFAALACLVALVGCDQFAAVGVEPAPLGGNGATPDVPPMTAPDAMTELDATTSEQPDAMTSEPDAMVMDAGPDAAAQCPPVQIQGCNPVTNEFVGNEGCGPATGQQCGIDHLNVLTGYCVFTSTMPPLLGGACFNSGVTESCPPTSTCSVDGLCLKICLCDADCPAQQCCTEPVGATGFSVCRDC